MSRRDKAEDSANKAEVPKELSNEPVITYSRGVALKSHDGYNIKLKDLRFLLREASTYGYSDDASVTVYTSQNFFYGYEVTIHVSDKQPATPATRDHDRYKEYL